MSIIKKDPYAALKYSDFRKFLFAKILITVAYQIQSVVVGWHIYELTKDPLSLGLIGLAEIIPNFSIALFAGHFADVYNRKKMVIFSYALFILSGILMWATSQYIPRENQTTYLYLLVGVIGFSRGIGGPSMFSIMTECVPKEAYVNSTTWHSTLWQISFVIGAGISGFLYYWLSYDVYLFFTALLILASASVLLIKVNHEREIKKHDNIFVSIKEGIHFVFNNQIFLGALSLDLFAVLFGGAVALLPIYANEILHVGPKGLGFLKAAPAVGSFTMAGLLVFFPPVKDSGKKLLLAVMGFGICMIIFGVSKNYYLSLFVLALSGAFDNISVVVRGTIMQTYTPAHMKGRVSSVNSLFIGSSNELGAFESGVAAKVLGVVPSVVFGGLMTLLIVAVTYIKAPNLTSLNIDE